jgi:hypothetical protein
MRRRAGRGASPAPLRVQRAQDATQCGPAHAAAGYPGRGRAATLPALEARPAGGPSPQIALRRRRRPITGRLKVRSISKHTVSPRSAPERRWRARGAAFHGPAHGSSPPGPAPRLRRIPAPSVPHGGPPRRAHPPRAGPGVSAKTATGAHLRPPTPGSPPPGPQAIARDPSKRFKARAPPPAAAHRRPRHRPDHRRHGPRPAAPPRPRRPAAGGRGARRRLRRRRRPARRAGVTPRSGPAGRRDDAVLQRGPRAAGDHRRVVHPRAPRGQARRAAQDGRLLQRR